MAQSKPDMARIVHAAGWHGTKVHAMLGSPPRHDGPAGPARHGQCWAVHGNGDLSRCGRKKPVVDVDRRKKVGVVTDHSIWLSQRNSGQGKK